jgi:hypothetical protein
VIVDHAFGANYVRSGSYRRFWAARTLLYEKTLGVILRESERAERTAEDKLYADYQRSIRQLRQLQDE